MPYSFWHLSVTSANLWIIYWNIESGSRIVFGYSIGDECQAFISRLNIPRLIYEYCSVSVAILGNPNRRLLFSYESRQGSQVFRSGFRIAAGKSAINVIVDRDHLTADASEQEGSSQ